MVSKEERFGLATLANTAVQPEDKADSAAERSLCCGISFLIIFGVP